MKILCCGDRRWNRLDIIQRELRKFPEGTEVVEGEAAGADTMSRIAAEELGFKVHKHPANWSRFGRAAGPIRNQAMLNKHHDIELVLAFHNDLANSKGTRDMVKRARFLKIEVRLITENDE